jgi:NADH-quinone oxidoreductase subunit E
MAATAESALTFSKELDVFIEEWKTRPGNLIMILHRVQEEFGYVPREAALELSHRLDVPLAKIYGVVTFYHLFKLRKPGKHQVSVCMGTACYLRGGEDLLGELETILGIGPNSMTEDGEFSIESVRCLGCCGLAPVLTIDREVFGKVTKDALPDMIAKYKGT